MRKAPILTCSVESAAAGLLVFNVLVWAATCSQCRLEANYGHQQELDMIPLMMQKDYKPQGWRKPQPIELRVTCPYVAIVMR